jgi:hypothetical protein
MGVVIVGGTISLVPLLCYSRTLFYVSRTKKNTILNLNTLKNMKKQHNKMKLVSNTIPFIALFLFFNISTYAQEILTIEDAVKNCIRK